MQLNTTHKALAYATQYAELGELLKILNLTADDVREPKDFQKRIQVVNVCVWHQRARREIARNTARFIIDQIEKGGERA